ncbi:MAG: Na+/H+ antiporter NhaC family protein [Firmicutes bacterium]|nr:Na+/H+ antiporter NhaC family protein [Bacillota bacterium]MBR6584714.1 Na+/H+ antiporter NhaC family protein [Bacillota bacterium]
MNFVTGLLKFSPVFVLAGLMISGQDALIAAFLACVVAFVVAGLVAKVKFQEALDAAMGSVSHILVALFILMFAYAMAEAFMSYGVGASIINIALSLGVTAKSVACVGFVCCALLSVATGTSWGTFAACAPIFLWLSHIVDGNVILTVCAIAGGACFGDNIGLISDTTIVSSGIQGVEVIHRIRHQGVWSISCLVLAAICFFVAGIFMGLPGETVNAANVMAEIPADVFTFLSEERPAAVSLLEQVASGVPIYMVIPLVLVIGLAVAGFNTFICIGSGLVSAYVLGLVAGTAGSIQSFLDDIVYVGFEGAGAWVIIMMMWVAAFGGVMQKMDAFAPLAALVVKLSKKVRHLMGWNAVLSLLGNAALSDEMAQIVTIGPVISQIVDENVEGSEEDMYTLHLRNATFSDALGVFGSQLIPWHVYLGFYVGIASGVYPLVPITNMDFLKYNFMAYIAVGSIIILTFTGLDRFVPLFKLPSEPAVQLKKKTQESKAA